jgi:hypothetical protein
MDWEWKRHFVLKSRRPMEKGKLLFYLYMDEKQIG